MRNILGLSIYLSSLIMLNSCVTNPTTPETTNDEVHPYLYTNSASWYSNVESVKLVILYGDNSLVENAYSDYEELMCAGALVTDELTNKVLNNMVVLFYLDISSTYGSFPAWMAPGGLFQLYYTNGYTEYPFFRSGIQRVYMPTGAYANNSGSAENLEDVLAWVVSNYGLAVSNTSDVSKARSLDLILWDHGNGWQPMGNMTVSNDVLPYASRLTTESLGIDEGTRDALSENEMIWAISNAGIYQAGSVSGNETNWSHYVNLRLGIDACYMGNIETVYRYLVQNNEGTLSGISSLVYASSRAVPETGLAYGGMACDMTFSSLPDYVFEFRSSEFSNLIMAPLNRLYELLIGDDDLLRHWITNLSMNYMVASSDSDGEFGSGSEYFTTGWHYVRIADVFRDMSVQFGGELTTLYNKVFSSGSMTNTGMWVPCFQQYYDGVWFKTWHSSDNIRLFQDDPAIAEILTNALFGQTSKSEYLFAPTYYSWKVCGTTVQSGMVNVLSNYKAYPLLNSVNDGTAENALELTSVDFLRKSVVNVGFNTGAGETDVYKFSVTTPGYVRFRVSSYIPKKYGVNAVTLSNAATGEIIVKDQLQSLTSGPCFAVANTYDTSISTNMTELGLVRCAEIYTNLTTGTWYLYIASPATNDERFLPTERPYLMYSLSLTNGETAATVD